MKYLLIALTFLTFSCSDESSSFIQKDHEVIKTEISVNYEKNKQAFQSLAKEVAAFKILRSIQFKYGRSGLDGINIYCDSIDRNGEGYAFMIQNLNDSRLQKVLNQEGATKTTIENIKQRLDQIKCNSFSTLRQSGMNTGTPYVHVEFEYNDWNGANFYFYKLFDRKMEPDMINFFDRARVVLGQIK
ncbi:MAG: hypothetical protein JWR72_61, partial [Flavisolibacter sp.]|nr:hypothetical protein [Flavisolibacter sp.]